MNAVFSFVITFLMGAFRSRLSLQLEIAALRNQLSMYQRTQRRPVIASNDRFLWSLWFLAEPVNDFETPTVSIY